MNDRFKFRAAVKQGIEWQIYDVLNILYKLDGTIWVRVIRQTETATLTAWFQVDGENAILEQCTGLKDKNGKLIYDGDVVKTKDFGKDIDNRINVNDYDTFVVKFHECGFYIENDSRRFPMSCRPKLEIIGNIHEMEVTK